MRAEKIYNLFGQIRIKTKSAYNLSLIYRLKIDLNKILGKNPLDGLVKPVKELVKSIIKRNSKVQKFKIHNEVVNN